MRLERRKPMFGEVRVVGWFAWLPARVDTTRPDCFLPDATEWRWLERVRMMQRFVPFGYEYESEPNGRWQNERFVDGEENENVSAGQHQGQALRRPDHPPRHP